MFLLFSSQKDRLSIESRFVEKIIPRVHFTPLPSTPSFFLGYINKVGKPTPLIDFTLFFSKEPSSLSYYSRIIFLSFNGKEVAFLAEKVDETERQENIELLETPIQLAHFPFIDSIWMKGTTPVFHLNVEKLFEALSPLLKKC